VAEQALSGEYPVEVTGVVHLPLVGELQVSGLSLSDTQRRIRELYAEAMKNPVVSTTPVFPVAIMGEVPSPGVFPTEPTHNVMGCHCARGRLHGPREAQRNSHRAQW
jgi:protein involved in polysaccharide export with SLBB domain